MRGSWCRAHGGCTLWRRAHRRPAPVPSQSHPLECLAHFEGVVLRLQPAHIQEVAPWLQPQTWENGHRFHSSRFCAVGDEGSLFPVALQVVILNRARIGHHCRRQKSGQPLRDQIPGFGRAVPFLALTFETIHVQRDRNSHHSRRKGEDGVGAVAIDRHVGTIRQQMQSGDEGVRDRVEVFVANGGQVAERYATVSGSVWRSFTAVDRSLHARARRAGLKVLRRKSRIRRIGLECRVSRGWRSAAGERRKHH